MERFKISRLGFPEDMKHLENQGVTISWYDYKQHPVSCYYYAYKTEGRFTIPLYVGHTQNLKERVPTICNQCCKTHNEATHITYFVEENKSARIRNRDRIAKFFFQG
ncbi:hypothetical protein M3664_04530 [Paenibacillus lautus]|uniref:hypothetical protein n=1 Tax=Paenibacillus lautus TaxID=1401 RepID=UPI002042622D|nr:hypothetical protein [Paenibacillus lautus]MCM3257047.1 hypothetical protein [Paenibacillus lautus]